MTKKNSVVGDSEQTDGIRYLDIRRCALRFGIDQRTWRRMVDKGEAPKPVRFGRAPRWSLDSLLRWESERDPNQER